jgi:hypothetical protein
MCIFPVEHAATSMLQAAIGQKQTFTSSIFANRQI